MYSTTSSTTTTRLSTWTVLCAVVAASLIPHQAQEPLIPTVKDNLIKDIPPLGLGLWNSKDESAAYAVTTAFEAGYTHLDSAAAYFNEKFVGSALSNKSAPARHEYWITSKLWNDMHRPENVGIALNKTLSDLNTHYLDLYLMHWPVAFKPGKPGRTIIDDDTSILDTWRAMEKLVSKNRTHPEPGTTRFIGISNFSPRQLDEILDNGSVRPYAHEFETHPWLQQQEFVDWHHKNDVRVIAYSPLANLNPTYEDKFPDLPRIIDDPVFVDLGKSKNATAAQVVLAWNLARDVVVIPKSVHENYIVENLGALDVTLDKNDLDALAEQDKRARFNDPGKSWGVELFEGLDGGSNRFLGYFFLFFWPKLFISNFE